MSRLRHYGFPCMLRTLGMTSSRTLRLGNFTKDAWEAKVKDNISDLKAMVNFSAKQGFKFFRIGSGVVPFGSHTITSKHDWTKTEIGDIVKNEGLRISMHPDHFCVLNAVKEETLAKSIADLDYHAKLMDAMGLDDTHKMQVHVGGVFGDKTKAIAKWCETYNTRLSERVRARLVLENDDTRYSLADVLKVHAGCHGRLPILFDTFHHECLNNGEPLADAFRSAAATWATKDGPPLLDYSSQDVGGGKKGKHAETLDPAHFLKVIRQLDEVGLVYDVMLEIKDKETSAFKVRLVDPWSGGDAGVALAKALTAKKVTELVGSGKQYGQQAVRVKPGAPRGHGKSGKRPVDHGADADGDEADGHGDVDMQQAQGVGAGAGAGAGAGSGSGSGSGSGADAAESKKQAAPKPKPKANAKAKAKAKAAPSGGRKRKADSGEAADVSSSNGNGSGSGEPAAKRRRTREKEGQEES